MVANNVFHLVTTNNDKGFRLKSKISAVYACNPYKQMISVAKLKQRIRPNRSYPRVSFKPRNSWTACGKANAY